MKKYSWKRIVPGLLTIALLLGPVRLAYAQYKTLDLFPAYLPSQKNIAIAYFISRENRIVGSYTIVGSTNAIEWLLGKNSSESEPPGQEDITPRGFQNSAAYSIWGQKTVGYAIGASSNGQKHAILWRSSSSADTIDLNPTGFDVSEALGIYQDNEVGYGLRGEHKHALLWSGSVQSVVDLNPVGYSESIAFAISNDHQVGYGLKGEIKHALLWSGSAKSAVDLNPAGYSASEAHAIDAGQMVGYGLKNGHRHALLWPDSRGRVIDLHPAGYTASEVNGVGYGKQVGYGIVGGHKHALVWSGSVGSVIDLNKFLPAEFRDAQAYALNPDGKIVGYATGASGQHAFLWLPLQTK